MIGAFPLPALSKDQPPAFESAQACQAWLAQVPLANPIHAQSAFAGQLNLCNRYALAPAARMQILELLRESVVFVQNENARKFAGRPLPLAAAEQAAFDANRNLWQALCVGYQHCLAACLEGEQEISANAAQVAHRALATLGAEQLDYYLAAHEMGPSFWRRVHALYSAAAEMGVAEESVVDPLYSRRSETSVRAAYAHLILMHAASPYELSSRNLGLAHRWLRRWSRKVTVARSEPAASKFPALAVDLSGDEARASQADATGNLRWLGMDEVARSLKKRITLLRQGATPASLQLGDDVPPGAEVLLRHLYERCCKATGTRPQRRPGAGTCQLAVGMPAIHFHITGKPFQAPLAPSQLTRLQHDEIAILGRIASHHPDDTGHSHNSPLEDWNIVDENPSGLRVALPASRTAQRVGVGFLLGLRPPGGGGLLLGCARWVSVDEEGQLSVGLRLMPGVPQAVTLQLSGPIQGDERYQQAFLLPPVAALQRPASIVMERGNFRPARVVAVQGRGTQQIRLTRVAEPGTDFERVEYEAV